MKAQLVVVQGKPEGKVIPLLGPIFKIGRGEGCHLRPNSDLVSREHVEFTIAANSVIVRDLDSRNGTLLNGKPLSEPSVLKDRDLVQVGNLTFAVSIQGAPAAASKAPTITGKVPAVAKAAVGEASSSGKGDSSGGLGNDLIDSWLVADNSKVAPEPRSEIYEGETITMAAFKGAPAAAAPSPLPAAPPPQDGDDDVEYERLPEGLGDEDGIDVMSDTVTEEDAPIPEEFLDESNPFHSKKPTSTKPAYKDSSDAASDILKKMMERRRRPT